MELFSQFMTQNMSKPTEETAQISSPPPTKKAKKSASASKTTKESIQDMEEKQSVVSLNIRSEKVEKMLYAMQNQIAAIYESQKKLENDVEKMKNSTEDIDIDNWMETLSEKINELLIENKNPSEGELKKMVLETMRVSEKSLVKVWFALLTEIRNRIKSKKGRWSKELKIAFKKIAPAETIRVSLTDKMLSEIGEKILKRELSEDDQLYLQQAVLCYEQKKKP